MKVNAFWWNMKLETFMWLTDVLMVCFNVEIFIFPNIFQIWTSNISYDTWENILVILVVLVCIQSWRQTAPRSRSTINNSPKYQDDPIVGLKLVEIPFYYRTIVVNGTFGSLLSLVKLWLTWWGLSLWWANTKFKLMFLSSEHLVIF